MTTKINKSKSSATIKAITDEIAAEREAQVARWGQQDHPSTFSDIDRKRAEKNADRWKEMNDARVKAGTLTWDGILLEEVWEALAEKDLDARRMELIQVAAVAAAEVEAIDRRVAASAVEAGATERSCPVTDSACEVGCESECLLAETEPDTDDVDPTHPTVTEPTPIA